MEIEKLIDRYFVALERNYMDELNLVSSIEDLDRISLACGQVQMKFESKFKYISKTEYYEKKRYAFGLKFFFAEYEQTQKINGLH